LERTINYGAIDELASAIGVSSLKVETDFLIYGYHVESQIDYAKLKRYRQNFHELSVDFSAICHFSVNGELVPNVTNRIVYVHPRELVEISLDNAFRRRPAGYSIFFTDDFIDRSYYKSLFKTELAAVARVNRVPETEIKAYQNVVENIFHEYRNYDPFTSPLVITKYLEILLIKLIQLQTLADADQGVKFTASQTITKRFLSLASEAFQQGTTIREYAEQLHVSPGHLTDVVRAETGKTPSQIINEFRLQHIKYLLTKPDKAIKEISAAFQFAEPNNFSSYFRKHTGMTPTQFRELNS